MKKNKRIYLRPTTAPAATASRSETVRSRKTQAA